MATQNKPFMSICPECGSNHITETLHTMEHEENGKVFVIENIPALQCDSCKEIFFTPEASRYIDKQLSIFRSEGFINDSKDVIKLKGLTHEQIGERLGNVSKQRVGQIVKSDHLDTRVMIKLSQAVNEPVEKLFKFKHIERVENRYYIK